jgi:glutaredoxin
MSALRLYGTAHCHLCEAAESVLQSAGVTAEKIDIMETPALLECYATRIPVLYREDSARELDWPFDGVAVQNFLR